ncbi:hypothetical protein GRI58_14180 [Porphyrobacter algicida]|uniref:Uncharacterized protein n=1 Tax=Qipengyuania algicida TaxID=1836209 RepID=A0A845AM48_9SPHN|nr:SUKH-3 domain-containing protein [Qipengyuania algicida]MXP29955.1 hypothetical protein [Qipengyuania algicida]
MEVLSSAIEPEFRRAGWVPERRVQVSTNVPRDHRAFDVLQSFGGLKVGETGRGEECAKSDVEFYETDMPDQLVEAWQTILKCRFVGIGECHHGHGQLWLDETGRLFNSGLAGMPKVSLEGTTFAEGMERLLRGFRSKPMLLPWQTQVTVWGEVFRAGDVGVLSAESFVVS